MTDFLDDPRNLTVAPQGPVGSVPGVHSLDGLLNLERRLEGARTTGGFFRELEQAREAIMNGDFFSEYVANDPVLRSRHAAR